MAQGTHDLHAMSDEGEAAASELEAERMRRVYEYGKRAPIGVTIHCPTCSTLVTKKTRGHVFCRSKGIGNCKDKFWNRTDDTRRDRVKRWT